MPPVALEIKPEVPLRSARNRTAITDKTIETASPGNPANQELPITPIVRSACCGKLIFMERE